LGFLLGSGAITLVIVSLLRLKDQLTLNVFFPELATASGERSVGSTLLSLLFSLTVLVGLRFTGVLVSSALTIVPSITAHHLTNKISMLVTASGTLSILAVSTGSLFSALVL
jgi:ABC-type Mn2+/Zn2+ transport system permease subunit